MITLTGLGKWFGDQTLFANVSLQLNPGARYGLVGANGSGKTTLLGILAGDTELSDGAVSMSQRLKLGVLRQDQFLYEDQTILGATLMGNADLWKVMSEKEALLEGESGVFDADRFSELEEMVQRLDGYTAEAHAATILEGLGLPTEVHYEKLSTLSGGFRLRVLLAQVLAGKPDVLLLDEPTNHLDILSIRWLETFLRDFSGTAMVISHDHRFLDNVTTHILDVDYQTIELYHGDFSAFVGAKKSERARREKEIANREREIAHHQKFVDRFRAKATKARQAQSKLRVIERKSEEMVELPPSSRRYPTFRFEQVRDSGREVLCVEGIKKAFNDNEVLHGVDLEVRRGDRLAIMGPNGIGKSTLLKIIMGDLEPNAGEVKWGYETHLGYFAQDHREQFEKTSISAEQWISSFCPGKSVGFVRGRLALMLFSGDDAQKYLGALSGGEATRLVFARLGIAKPNVLVLDEPTNHLDMESIEALVEGLRSYHGTLILVSHDRWFIAQLASRVVEIRSDGIRDYEGTYEEYVHYCGDDHLDTDRVILKARHDKKKKDARNEVSLKAIPGSQTTAQSLSKAEKKRALQRQEDLLARLDAAETRLGEIDSIFCQVNYYEITPTDEVQKLEVERTGLVNRISELTADWERVETEFSAAS